jgi:hypothetical protein
MARQMTDREMLMLCYGALKAAEDQGDLSDVVKLLEAFLWPPVEDEQPKKTDHMAAVRASAKS